MLHSSNKLLRVALIACVVVASMIAQADNTPLNINHIN